MILRRLLYRHIGTLVVSVGLSLASAAVTTRLLGTINDLVNGVRLANVPLLHEGLELLALLFALNMSSQLLLARLGNNMATQARSELARHLIDIDYQQTLNNKTFVFGALMEDVARIVPLVMWIPQFTYNLLLVGMVSLYLFHTSPQLSGVLGGLLVITVSISVSIGKAMGSRFDSARRAEEAVFDCFRAISDGKKEMSLSPTRRRHFVDKVFDPALQSSRIAMQRAQASVGAHTAWAMTVLYGAIFAVAYVGYDEFALPLNTVAHFVVAALFLINPIAFVTQGVQQLSPGLASMRHLSRMGLDLAEAVTPETTEEADSGEPPDWQRIAAAGIKFRYPGPSGATFEFGPFDLEIRRGETVFLTGGNGSGKSTLLLLLCGLLRPSAGALLVDGIPVREDPAVHRRRFAGTFGETFLFPHVLDGDGGPVADAEITECLEWLGLADVVQAKNGELTRLSLSTGQRKRLAFLQCHAEDREILFFDEWAADQDAHFREYFYCTLLARLKQLGKTLIVISHDNRYFYVADRIIRLDGGRIIDDRCSCQVPLMRSTGSR